MFIEEIYEQLSKDPDGIEYLRSRDIPDETIRDLMRIQEHIMNRTAGLAVPLAVTFSSVAKSYGAAFLGWTLSPEAFQAIPRTLEERKGLTECLNGLVQRAVRDLGYKETSAMPTFNPPEILEEALRIRPR